MKHRLAALAAATGLGAAALLAGVPAGAQEGALPLTIDPTSGPVGTEVVLTGGGCLGEQGPGAIQAFVDGIPVEDQDPENPVIADEAGDWLYVIVPQEGTSPGTYQITATCFVNDGSGTAMAEYGPAAFEVTGDPASTTTVPAPPAEEPEEPAPAAPVVATPTFTG